MAVKEDALEIVQPTPIKLLEMAVAQNLDIEKIKQLMDLQERWEKNEARKAFVSAMNAFKAHPPTILKNKQVDFGNTHYRHATLDHVCDVVTKALSDHGISHSWKTAQDQDLITVTCVLTHEMGHSEETTLKGSPDSSGSKNSIQAVGSTLTYLQRYSLLAACGLAAANTDNDGAGASTNGELAEQLEYIANASDPGELKRLYKIAYEMFEDTPAALRQLIEARKARIAERGW